MNDFGRRILILITKFAVNAMALFLVTRLFSETRFHINGVQTMIAASVILALVNTYIKPLVLILTLPINIVMLGLFTLVVNGLMLWFVSWLLRPDFFIDKFFWTAVWAALVMSLISIMLNWFLKPPKAAPRQPRPPRPPSPPRDDSVIDV